MPETNIIVLYLTDIVFLTTNILLLHIFLTAKRSLWFQAVVFTAAGVAVHLLRFYLAPWIPNFVLRGFLTGPLYLIPCTLLFKETLQARIFVFFLIYSMTQFNYLVFMHIDRFLVPPVPDTWVIIGLLLELASLPLINKYVAPHIKNIIALINRQNPSFTLFPFMSFVLLAYYGVQGSYVLVTFVPVVLSTTIIFFAYYLISLSIDRTKRHQLLEKQLALQCDHYRNLNDSIATAKATRHDLRHHLATLAEFLGRKDAVGAQDYLNKLCNYYDDSNIPTVCRHQPADALVCHYLKLAKLQGIAVTANLHIPDDLGIDDLDLCVIIGNCLENAMEACAKMAGPEPRFIDIKAAISKGYLLIKIVNSFDGRLQAVDGGFVSSKRGTGDGIGLSSVKTLAAKYHGQHMISFDHQTFGVSVSLKLPESVGEPQPFHISV